MNRFGILALSAAICLFFALEVRGQIQRQTDVRQADPSPTISKSAEPGSSLTVSQRPQAVVPRLMKFSGVLHDPVGKPLTDTVDVTFSLYSTEAGGSPLWFETQSVQADELGRYTALLGAMHTEGLPLDLFTSGEVRWLGIQVGLEAEQPRVLLVSVPYALKAGDAETLGGKPASAYMLSDAQSGTATVATTTSNTGAAQTRTGGTTQKSRNANTTPLTACAAITSGGTAVANSIARFTTACNIENSVIAQSGTNVGIGTTTPAYKLDVVGGSARVTNPSGTTQLQISGSASSGRLGQDAAGFFFASDTNGQALRFLTNNGALHEWMRVTSAGNVGVGTLAPAHKLDVVGEINAASSGPSTTITGTYTGTTYDAVDGLATSATGPTVGVFGASQSNAGSGVYGYAGAASGITYGLYGQAVSTNGIGVYGQGGQWAGLFAGNLKINGAGNGINFPDGTKQITAASPTFGSFNATSLFNNFPSVNPVFIRINGNSSASANEAYRASVMPVACTATNLTVASSGATNLSVILRVNGGSSSLGCTISGGTSCTDNTHTVAITPGNLLSLEFAGGSTGTIIYTAFTCG